MTQANIDYGSRQAVGLVAGREISTRMRSKAFRVFTGLMMALMIIGVLIVKLISGMSSGPDATIGVTAQTAGLAAPVTATAKGIGENIATRQVASEADGNKQITDGKLDALLVGTGSDVQVVVKKELDRKLQTVFDSFAGQQALNNQIHKLGGDPGQVATQVGQAKATVKPLEPPYPYDVAQLVLGAAAGVLIYLVMMMNAQAIAQGVVEEKQSRVVELLLATVKPWQMLFGKILGIGALGLAQMVLIGAAAVIPAALTGLLPSVGAAAGTVVWLVVWFVLGFLAYALVFAGLGALVSRQEDIGQVISLPLMLLIAGYVVGISVLPSNPGSRFVEILSIIPTFSPTLMPMRIGMGGVPVWEIVLALVLLVAFIPGLLWLSARIYRNAIVRTGTKVRFRDALRAA
ncbi:ABC transporter permease [Sciscionella marina]|uniref:ABC transporter permease n=1 Tax=Sciscionella marina TaxID=508770 RepID=UPI0003606D43|nr:ABC transporter permease [Sciscionella marina]